MVDRLFDDAKLAALYDAFSGSELRDDFRFYLPLVMEARSVLDVGCGTGALLHRAREAGHTGRLCGLDPAHGMLEQARKRSDVEWILGDLGSVAFEREFDLVVMTGHAFQVLLGDDELRSALEAVRRALMDGGRFAFETRNPAVREWESWRDREVERSGDVLRMSRRIESFDGELLRFSHTFTSSRWARPEVSRSTLRFVGPAALAAFLSDAGLAIESQFGDFDRGPLTETSPEIITVAAS